MKNEKIEMARAELALECMAIMDSAPESFVHYYDRMIAGKTLKVRDDAYCMATRDLDTETKAKITQAYNKLNQEIIDAEPIKIRYMETEYKDRYVAINKFYGVDGHWHNIGWETIKGRYDVSEARMKNEKMLGEWEMPVEVFQLIAHRYSSLGGSVKSEKKAKAVRENGKKGGRPKKNNGMEK